MYTKKITFKQYLPKFDQGSESPLWVEKELRTTNDAIWLHLNALELRKDVKEICVVDYV